MTSSRIPSNQRNSRALLRLLRQGRNEITAPYARQKKISKPFTEPCLCKEPCIPSEAEASAARGHARPSPKQSLALCRYDTVLLARPAVAAFLSIGQRARPLGCVNRNRPLPVTANTPLNRGLKQDPPVTFSASSRSLPSHWTARPATLSLSFSTATSDRGLSLPRLPRPQHSIMPCVRWPRGPLLAKRPRRLGPSAPSATRHPTWQCSASFRRAELIEPRGASPAPHLDTEVLYQRSLCRQHSQPPHLILWVALEAELRTLHSLPIIHVHLEDPTRPDHALTLL